MERHKTGPREERDLVLIPKQDIDINPPPPRLRADHEEGAEIAAGLEGRKSVLWNAVLHSLGIQDLTVAVVIYTRPTRQDQVSLNPGADGVNELQVPLLLEGESLFSEDMIPGKLPRSQWVAPHLWTYGGL